MSIDIFNQKDELFKTYNNVYAIDFEDSNKFGIYDNDSHKLLVGLPFEKFYYVENDNKKEKEVKQIVTDPKELSSAINKIGYENILSIVPCNCYDGCIVVVLYKENRNENSNK